MFAPHRLLVLTLLLFLAAAPVAADESPLEIEFATGQLTALAAATGPVVIAGVPLRAGEPPAVLELRPLQLLAPDARLVIHSEAGEEVVPFPPHRQFAGEIRGEAGSRVAVTLLAEGEVRGVVSVGTEHWLFRDEGSDLWLAAVDAGYLPESVGGFQCDGALEVPEPELALPPVAGRDSGPFVPDADPVYRARIAVETDYEFLQKFGGNTSQATAYIYGLYGYASTIYRAEIGTELEIVYVSLWTTADDPWNQPTSQTDPKYKSECAFYEFGRYWNNNHASVQRTTAQMLSGKNTGSGIAWVGVLCNPAFNQNHGGHCPGLTPQTSNYGGAYSFVGSISGSFNPGNPVVMWDIMSTSHEMGHNYSSRHTHCFPEPGANLDPVDGCYNNPINEPNCYSGPVGLPGIGTLIGGTQGQGNGTIMSYCHLLPGNYSNISLTFGLTHPYGVAANRVPAQMRGHVVERAGWYPGCMPLAGIFADGFEHGLVPPWSGKAP